MADSGSDSHGDKRAAGYVHSTWKMKKPLRSCVRCRKNKIKCDSATRRPKPCSSCLKKGVGCELEYVIPPQRSKELRSLYENVAYVRLKLNELMESCDQLLDYCHASVDA
ncbi:ACL195Cp [Eremothecium gossypii ATCC 10895]|uniref:ACL195Cp n=1 Tax=Eremothecium gossypii (strain ATCC 10895 / CBS 109.51 / FGSC 9923 / NRRL Y-1056) TaxID=284811 RepID=Q75CW1_EREGS|nr:ACL195Cp [Eremothecium gossypii ATCC 10895]AAS51033.1 ACL195Cp [Eremothecium gossypii ATCC 10895]AEY95323.1 FACL195Cp [Eremothecium gossypii FDAG1]